jgi:hypothetical protein
MQKVEEHLQEAQHEMEKFQQCYDYDSVVMIIVKLVSCFIFMDWWCELCGDELL